MDCDVLVVGGGPIGSAIARDIAKSGYRVIVLEEDSEIGKPVRCSGIVSPKLVPLANVSDEIVLNELSCAYLYNTSGKKLLIGDNKVRAVAIDREKLDKLLAEQAISSGAEYIMNAKAVGVDHSEENVSNIFNNTENKIIKNSIKNNLIVNFLRNSKSEKVETKLVIGADGVNSNVSKWFGFEEPREIINALTFDTNSNIPNKNSVELLVSKEHIPGFFAWIVPISNKKVRFGMGISSNSNKSLKYCFNKLKQLNLNPFSYIFRNLDDNKISVGQIPLGSIKKAYANRVMIVGDAACHVKPLTGGGLYYGLISAKRCAQVAVKALKNQDFSENFLSKYQKLWVKDIGLEIEQGFILREIFLYLNDEEINELMDIFGKHELLNIVNRYGDIDYPWKLALKIITKKPKILIYLKKYIIDSKLKFK